MPFYGSRGALYFFKNKIRWWEFCFSSPRNIMISSLLLHTRDVKHYGFLITLLLECYDVLHCNYIFKMKEKLYYRHILSVLMPSLLYIFLMRFSPKRRESLVFFLRPSSVSGGVTFRPTSSRGGLKGILHSFLVRRTWDASQLAPGCQYKARIYIKWKKRENSHVERVRALTPRKCQTIFPTKVQKSERTETFLSASPTFGSVWH